MDPGRGRVVGRARGRPVPPTTTASSVGGASTAPIPPPQELLQPPGFQHSSASQPTGAVGGRASVRGNGQMRAGTDEVVKALSKLSVDTESTQGSNSGKEAIMASGDRPRARRGMGAEVILTRPKHIDDKRGSSGHNVNIVTNLFRLVRKANFSFHHFNVSFNPEIVNPHLRKGMIHQLKDNFGSNYLFDGSSLYLPVNLEKREMEFTLLRRTDNIPIVIRIRHVAVLSPSSPVCIQIFNIIFKKVLNHIGLQLMQHNYYNPHQAIDIKKYNLSIWPGYMTSILQYEVDTSLLADISHKILSTKTVLEQLYEIHSENNKNYQSISQNLLSNQIILTRYNNKTYKVDDIDWSKNPTNAFELRNNETQTYIQYYEAHYGIKIKDMQQPLIMVMPSRRERRAGQDGPIYLVPELCYITGLTSSARKDMTMMRELAAHTRIGPQDRVNTLRGFIRQIKGNEKAMCELQNWNMDLDNDLMEIAARVLTPERIYLGLNYKLNISNTNYNPESADWAKKKKVPTATLR